MTNDQQTIRLSVHPEPDDEELLVILQALRLLQADQADSSSPPESESLWRSQGRATEQRSHVWPYQEQTWAQRS
jgi:hypothetical protein